MIEIALHILLVLFVFAALIVGGIAFWVSRMSFHQCLNLLYYIEFGDD